MQAGKDSIPRRMETFPLPETSRHEDITSIQTTTPNLDGGTHGHGQPVNIVAMEFTSKVAEIEWPEDEQMRPGQVGAFSSYRPLLWPTDRPRLEFKSQIQQIDSHLSSINDHMPQPEAIPTGDHFDDYTLRRLADLIVAQFDANKTGSIEKEEISGMIHESYDPQKTVPTFSPQDCELYLLCHDTNMDGR